MNWLRRIFGRKRTYGDLSEEIRAHLDEKVEALVANGMERKEAEHAARREFGNVMLTEENAREVWRWAWLENFLIDVRYALRVLRKSPGFTVVAILTLALGIGANTAIFSVVDLLAFRQPPIEKPERVATLAKQYARGDYGNGFSYPDYVEIRNQSTAVFSAVAGTTSFERDGLSAGGSNEPIWTDYVTGNFFKTMGVKPALGTLIKPAAGSRFDDEPVIVLGYSYWKAHFGGDPGEIGKQVLINGHPVTVIGVAQKGFHGITALIDAQGYLPLGMAAVTGDLKKDFRTNPESTGFGLIVVTRLKPGFTFASAQPALTVLARRIAKKHPADRKWRNLVAYALGPLSPVSDPSLMNAIALLSALFLTLAGSVLILACLNIANLLLVRGTARQREMALRSAVGGGRERLVCQLLTESFLLALLGCAGGIALGLLASRWLGSIRLMASVPFALDFRFDWRVFAYAFGTALVTALIVGIAPALRATRGNLNDLLHEGGRTVAAGHQRTRSILVVAQVGGSLMLLIVAGLFVRSLESAEHAPLGFEPRHVLNFTIDPRQAGYDKAQASSFLSGLLARVRALPAVGSASLAETVPMGPVDLEMDLKIQGRQPPAGRSPLSAGYNAVSSQYFKTMGIPLLTGRGFLDSDARTSPSVAVINQAMAKEYWPGENPIGRHFASTDDPKRPIEVVGVAGNSRMRVDFSRPIGPFLYVPLSQNYDYRMPVTLQVRTSLPAAAMEREVVGAVHSLAPTIPVMDIQTMTAELYNINSFQLFQIGAGLASLLGILGFALALVGVYGVVSYGASQRTHEIGIRLALGAQQADVLRMVLRQGVFIVGAGLVAGILAAAAIARLVGDFLYGVSPLDPITYLGASVLLAGVALLACYVPARRAMKVDSVTALRNE